MHFLKVQGYKDLFDYVTGWSNDSLIGWSGNGTLTTAQIVANASTWKDFHDIVNLTKVYVDKWGSVEMREVDTRIPMGKCFFLDEEKLAVNTEENFYVHLHFEDVDDAFVSVSLTDPNTVSWNPNLFSYSGDKIEKSIGKVDTKFSYFIDHYSIQVARVDELEKDQESGCLDYSQSHFGSYSNCMMTTAQQYFRNMLGCIPPWFRQGAETEVCQNRPKGSYDYMSMYTKFLERSTIKVTYFNTHDIVSFQQKAVIYAQA